MGGWMVGWMTTKVVKKMLIKVIKVKKNHSYAVVVFQLHCKMTQIELCKTPKIWLRTNLKVFSLPVKVNKTC